MRKFVLASVIATLGVAMLAIPASASFDGHFNVIEKRVSGEPVGEHAFRFKNKLVQPHNRDNRVGSDQGICREAPHRKLRCRAVVHLNGEIGGFGDLRVRGDSGGAITGTTSSGEPVISTASAARCCSSARAGPSSTSTWCANENETREGRPGAAGVGAAPLRAPPQMPGNVADRTTQSGIVFPHVAVKWISPETGPGPSQGRDAEGWDAERVEREALDGATPSSPSSRWCLTTSRRQGV